MEMNLQRLALKVPTDKAEGRGQYLQNYMNTPVDKIFKQ